MNKSNTNCFPSSKPHHRLQFQVCFGVGVNVGKTAADAVLVAVEGLGYPKPEV